MVYRLVAALGVMVLGAGLLASKLTAQGAGAPLQVAMRGPRFLRGVEPDAPPIDPAAVAMLRRRVTLPMGTVTLDAALRSLAKQTKVRLQYSRDVVPLERQLRFEGGRISLAAALTDLLLDAGVDVGITGDDALVLVKRRGEVVRWAGGSLVGRVTDSATGQGIGRAEVYLDGTHWKTETDSTGYYRLTEVDTGAYVLTARRLGYAKRSRRVVVRADRADTVDVVLPTVAVPLDELVSTATGPRRRRDIANDITVINADSVMQTAPIRSVTDLLDGRVPGLAVQRTSGAPGDPARLRLRGTGSPLGNNDPIVVVDGVRAYAEQSATRSANLVASGYAAPSPLDYIDPNSIETVEVVKGPSAATLYGPDAANGVIVITTKKGKAGPTRWTGTVEQGWNNIDGNFPDLFLRWGHWAQQNDPPVICPVGNANNTQTSGLGNSSLTCVADSLVRFQLLNDPAFTILGQGHRSSVSLGASGGSTALTYSITGSFQHDVGLPQLPSYEAERYQSLVGVSPPDWMQRPQYLTQWAVTSQVGARLGATANLSLSTRLSRTAQQRSSLENQVGSLMATYIDTASGILYTQTAGTQLSAGQDINDGFLTGYYQRVTDAALQFTNGLNLDWRPRPWFTVTADAGLDLVHRSDETLLPRGVVDTSGLLNVGQGTTIQSTVNLRGNALAPLGHGFQFRFALGANYLGKSIADQTLQTSFLPIGTTAQGTKIDGGARSLTDDVTFGWYLEPSIGNSKFNFSSGLRLDGGSSYGHVGSPFTFPTFPKLGLSYLLSEEPWFPLKGLVQSLRARVSYGRASTQPGISDRLRVYTSTGPIFVDGQFPDGAYLASIGNTQIRPERSTEIEGGFDADLLDSRINVVVTGYRKTTDDALMDKPLPPSVYGDNVNQRVNIGRIRNTGIELSVGAQVLRSGPVTWNTHVDLTQNRNVVVNLGHGVEPFYATRGQCGNISCGGTRVAAGYPLFGRWSVPILGYADANGDGVLQKDEVLLGDTAVYVGQSLPNYQAVFSTTLSLWHAVTLNAQFAYQDGLSQVNTVAQQLSIFSRGRNDSTTTLAEQAAAFTNIGTDYNWIQTVNTFRFNSISVSYRPPMAIVRRLGAQTLDISLQGSNLGLWTNYRGLDPNVNSFSTGNSVSDTGIIPQPRIWQLRVNATY